MFTHANKTQQNKTTSAASKLAQKQTSGTSSFQLVDNRPEAIAQRKLQEMANNSPQTKQASQLQAFAANHPAQQQQPSQKKASSESGRRVGRVKPTIQMTRGDDAGLEREGDVLEVGKHYRVTVSGHKMKFDDIVIITDDKNVPDGYVNVKRATNPKEQGLVKSDHLKKLSLSEGRQDNSLIGHHTVFRAPGGTPNTRMEVGIGEEVRFQSDITRDWFATSGQLNKKKGRRVQWKAPDKEGSSEIGFNNSDGSKKSIKISTIVPTGISVINKTNLDDRYPADMAGVGMYLQLELLPKTVSFGNVMYQEGPGEAEGITGYYMQVDSKTLEHQPTIGWGKVHEDNYMGGDNVTTPFDGEKGPYSFGIFLWECPFYYKETSSDPSDNHKLDYIQKFIMHDQTGKMTVEKFGESHTRTPQGIKRPKS
ncbi:MAG: hypothetical protein QNJ36_15290 [Calothrix sp. MO_167.B42]|nr:hypothetical protein [Calothrix sp. MO_167.B42]